jgi:hypothetical protein
MNIKRSKTIKKLIENVVESVLDETSLGQPLEQELHVYDFDDSLVETKGTIGILDKDTGAVREIKANTFHMVRLALNEEFILETFDNVLNASPLPLLNRMKEVYKRLGPNGVSVCTARSSDGLVRNFMTQQGMGDIEIAAVGDAAPRGDVERINASRKRSYLRKKILQRDLKILFFYDDNTANCESARTLQNEFPNVQITVEQIVRNQ